MEKDSGLLVVALVAIVSVVALVMLLRSESSGAVVLTMGGDLANWDRPLSSNSPAVYGNAENLPCWYSENGELICPEADTASPTAGRRV